MEKARLARLLEVNSSHVGTRWRDISAASVLRQPVRGPNWIAAGDAALAFDPLSGLGVHKAIESGLRAAEAIARYFAGDSTGMVEYEDWTVQSFHAYLATRHRFYSSVERWPGSPFWARRIDSQQGSP